MPSAITTPPTIGNGLYFPVRLTVFPARIEVTSSPITIGNVRSPEVVASTPWTYCKNVGRKVIEPSIAKPTTKLITVDSANTEFAEQPHRHHRFRRPPLDQDEQPDGGGGGNKQPDDHRGAPWVGGAAPAGGQRQAGGAQRDDHDAR